MYEWISAHKDVLQTLASVGSFMIWLIYAQLLYFGFRRQRRPRLIINRGKRKNLDALCVISNMSAEPIYLQHIMMTLETSEGDWTLDVSDHEADLDDDEDQQEAGHNASHCTHQGPLDSGGFVHIGSFNALKERITTIADIDESRDGLVFKAVCVRVIGTYCSENLPIGAERRAARTPHRFRVHGCDGQWRLRRAPRADLGIRTGASVVHPGPDAPASG